MDASTQSALAIRANLTGRCTVERSAYALLANKSTFAIIVLGCNRPYRGQMSNLTDHRISGPFRGYYLAFYAAAEDGGFLGYYKICTSQPVEYWGCQCVRKGCTEIIFSTREGALNAAEEAARMTLQNLRPAMS